MAWVCLFLGESGELTLGLPGSFVARLPRLDDGRQSAGSDQSDDAAGTGVRTFGQIGNA